MLSWAGRGCSILQERFVVHVTDVLAVSMMLGITAQVKEAGVAWDKGEKSTIYRPWRWQGWKRMCFPRSWRSAG